MSVTTNIVTKFKQLFYNAGATPDLVDTAVDGLQDLQIAVALPRDAEGNAYAAADDGSVAFTIPFNGKLVGCNYVGTQAMLNTAGDDIVVTVTTNGATAATYNSNAAAQGAIAANSRGAFSVNATNSFIDAGEICKVAYTMADNTNNFLNGIITLSFRRQ